MFKKQDFQLIASQISGKYHVALQRHNGVGFVVRVGEYDSRGQFTANKYRYTFDSELLNMDSVFSFADFAAHFPEFYDFIQSAWDSDYAYREQQTRPKKGLTPQYLCY